MQKKNAVFEPPRGAKMTFLSGTGIAGSFDECRVEAPDSHAPVES